MNKMLLKSTLSNIFTVICCVVIIVGIVSLISVIIGIRPFLMISESMHPEVPKNSLVLLDTSSHMDDVAIGDNVAYLLGKVEAMHKTVSVGSDELVVKSLADDGESTVTASTYVGKEVLSIPQVGGWIRKALDYKWIVIGIAGVLIVAVRDRTAGLEGQITVTKGSNEHLEEVEEMLKPLADGSVAALNNGLTREIVLELVENVWVGEEIEVEFKADSTMKAVEDELVG